MGEKGLKKPTHTLLTALIVSSHPRGLAKLAAFFSSHENFGIVREFSFLRSRLLLSRELEIAELEQKLLELVDIVVKGNRSALMSWELVEGDEPQRNLKSLLTDTNCKLKDYGKQSGHRLAYVS